MNGFHCDAWHEGPGTVSLGEAAQVNQTVRQHLVELEQQNPTEEPVHQQDRVSTTGPDATYATTGGTILLG